MRGAESTFRCRVAASEYRRCAAVEGPTGRARPLPPPGLGHHSVVILSFSAQKYVQLRGKISALHALACAFQHQGIAELATILQACGIAVT